MKNPPRLCLSLYACEPHRGSEPGVGWAWALGMAKRHETWVLTRANNREVIEAELDRLAIPDAERPHFIWVDLPRWVRWLKKRGIVPVGLYYLLWQFVARHAWDKTGIRVDIIHHVTFCSYFVPGVWWHRREKVVIGPMGGAAICPFPLLRAFRPSERLGEWVHGLVRSHLFCAPLFLVARRNADVIFFTESQLLRKFGGSKALESTMLDIAVPPELENAHFTGSGRKRQFLCAGLLVGRKGIDIAIQAYFLAFPKPEDAPKLLICGDGPYRRRLETLSRSFGGQGRVRFVGQLSQNDLWREMRSSLAFLFPSVRDTCGSVAVEALANGTPLVFFDHQGVHELTDQSCGIPVHPGSYASAVCDFADAMRRLADDHDFVERLGSSGRKRVLSEFTWKRKFDEADDYYKKIFSDTSSFRHRPPTTSAKSSPASTANCKCNGAP